jgi:fermentation-respiration switch protein FrsA (DUF1100 family)
MSRRVRVRLTVVVAVLVLLTASFARDGTMLGWLERLLLYFPSHDVAYPLTAFGPSAEEVWFGEHARLHGVFVPTNSAVAGTTGPGSTILFFHGNGGNLSHRAPLLARMRAELGASVFIFDYQGYGRSAGRPSEVATAADSRAAIRYLHTRPDVDPKRIVHFGESLGAAVAIDLAREVPPAGLVVLSSFTSIADLTRLHYPALTVLLPLASMRYDSLGAIGSLRVPLLVIHGADDDLVPAEHGRRLFAAANEPKRLLIVPYADHNDVIAQAGEGFWVSLRTFLNELNSSPD